MLHLLSVSNGCVHAHAAVAHTLLCSMSLESIVSDKLEVRYHAIFAPGYLEGRLTVVKGEEWPNT